MVTGVLPSPSVAAPPDRPGSRDAGSADLYDSGCSVLAAVTFPDQVVL
jgi:hypothetical protein